MNNHGFRVFLKEIDVPFKGTIRSDAEWIAVRVTTATKNTIKVVYNITRGVIKWMGRELLTMNLTLFLLVLAALFLIWNGIQPQ